MKAFVTGSAGFIGSRLARHLKSSGFVVGGCDLVFGESILNFDWLSKRLGDFQPDVVFHLAAQSQVQPSVKNPAGDAEVNVVGSINVFAAAENSGVRQVVYAGSGGTYWDQVSPYGISKAVPIDYLDLFDFASCTLLLNNVYGPRGHGVVEAFVDAKNQGYAPMIYGSGEQVRDFLWVGDVVKGLADVAAARVQGVIELKTGVLTSVNELWSLIGGGSPAQRLPELPGEVLSPVKPDSGYPAWIGAETQLKDGIAKFIEETA